MTAPTHYSHTVIPDDLAAEVERLALFDIHVEFTGLGYLDEEDFVPVAHFGPRKEQAGWWVRVSPAAPINEQFAALDRIWLAITHPKTHPMWEDGFEYGKDSVYFGAHLVRDRANFNKYLSDQVQQLLRTEMAKATPTMLSGWAKSDAGWFEAAPHRGLLDEHTEIIAGNIRAEMARQERSVPDLAEFLNLTPTTVRKSVKGTRPWRPKELDAVADWLDLDLDDLVAIPYSHGGGE